MRMIALLLSVVVSVTLTSGCGGSVNPPLPNPEPNQDTLTIKNEQVYLGEKLLRELITEETIVSLCGEESPVFIQGDILEFPKGPEVGEKVARQLIESATLQKAVIRGMVARGYFIVTHAPPGISINWGLVRSHWAGYYSVTTTHCG